MKRCRRPLILLALLLLVGAVVNSAVACITAHMSRARHGKNTGVSLAPTDYGYRVVLRWRHPLFDRIAVSAEQPGHWNQWSDHAPPAAPVPRWAGRAPDRSIDVINENITLTRAFGLPLRTLTAEAYLSGDVLHSTRGVLILRGASDSRRVPFETRDVIFIPTAVLPLGFAINTLFYTAILALPLSFFPIRRRLRARRGRCPKCGYDLAGLGGADPAAPCPECGATR